MRIMGSVVLQFEGRDVRAHKPLLCLTDMWRAAGSDDSKRPSDWARKEGAQFIVFIAESLNVPVGHIICADRGRDGATWAHWQIGFAYAKYLSPAFHAWCNDIVRKHMEEGNSPPAGSPITLDMLRAEMKAAIEAAIEPLVDDLRNRRKEPHDEDLHRKNIALNFKGYCPVYPWIKILDDKGEILRDERGNKLAEIDHHRRRNMPGVKFCWLISRQANRDLETGKRDRDDKIDAAFRNYQRLLDDLLPATQQPQFKLFDNPQPQTSAPRGNLKIAPEPEPEPEPIEPLPQLDLNKPAQPPRAIIVAQIIVHLFNNRATNKQIAEVYARLRPDIENPGASIRNAILRQRAGSKEHRGDYKDMTTLFRLADGCDEGVTSCTEAGIELAKRAGPLKL